MNTIYWKSGILLLYVHFILFTSYSYLWWASSSKYLLWFNICVNAALGCMYCFWILSFQNKRNAMYYTIKILIGVYKYIIRSLNEYTKPKYRQLCDSTNHMDSNYVLIHTVWIIKVQVTPCSFSSSLSRSSNLSSLFILCSLETRGELSSNG